MTTIAFRDGVMASDSRVVEQGIGSTHGPKIFRKKVGKRDVLIGGAGFSPSLMMFIDWYGSNNDDLRNKIMTLCVGDKEFEVMVWDGQHLTTCDEFCRLDLVTEKYYALGSGAAHAITAMDCGKSARQAVQMAMKRDINTGGRVVTARL